MRCLKGKTLNYLLHGETLWLRGKVWINKQKRPGFDPQPEQKNFIFMTTSEFNLFRTSLEGLPSPLSFSCSSYPSPSWATRHRRYKTFLLLRCSDKIKLVLGSNILSELMFANKALVMRLENDIKNPCPTSNIIIGIVAREHSLILLLLLLLILFKLFLIVSLLLTFIAMGKSFITFATVYSDESGVTFNYSHPLRLGRHLLPRMRQMDPSKVSFWSYDYIYHR
jgi:hypothetical protein